MYSRLKQSKRALSFVLALVLVLNIVLSSGFFHVAVQATGEAEPTVIYVDGVGAADGADGSTAEKAYKTIAQAYKDIPKDNTKTVIVICGEVHLDDSLVIAHQNEWYTQKIIGTGEGKDISYVKHAGTVVFTSKYGDKDYRKDSVGLYLDDMQWELLGNTTLENIDIRNDATRITANYYTLTFGEGIGVYDTGSNRIAATVTLGYTGNFLYDGYSTVTGKSILNVRPHDVVFTMKSGAIGTLNGTGINNQGWNNMNSDKTYVPFNVTLNIEGGTITTLTAVTNPANVSVNDVTISVAGSATVSTLNITNGTATVKRTKTIGFKDKTGNVSVAGFDALDLVNSSVTVSSLDTVKAIKTTDTSSLTVGTVPAPEEAIPVTVTKAGHKWESNGALITAPKGTAENMFTLTNTDGCAWEYADGNKATWTIVDDPDAFYVDGENGDDTNDGFSANSPLKTLTAAYKKIPTDNSTTYIVICGEVHLEHSLVVLATEEDSTGKVTTKYGIAKHAGTVVFTSEYKGVDYRKQGAGLYLGGINGEWNLLGKTAFENINIKEQATNLVANYYELCLGEGIGDEPIASSIVLGYNGHILYNAGVLKDLSRDIVFTMKSGTIGTLYGQGRNNQGWNNNDTNTTKYGSFDTTLNIEGGRITDRVYMATNPTASSINNVTLYIGGSANVPKVQGCYQTPTVKGELACVVDLAGQNKELYCNDNKFNLYVINTAYGSADGENAAKLTLTADGYVDGEFIQKITQDPDTKMRYAVVKNGNKYTPHPFNLTFAQVGLNTKAGENDEDVEICLRAMYLASDKAKPTDFGISHLESGNLENGVWKDYSALESAYSFNEKNLVNAFYNLSGALEKLENTNYYRVYMEVNGVTVYSDYIANITPRTVLTNINNQLKAGGYVSDTQRTSLEALVASNPDVGEILTYFNNN